MMARYVFIMGSDPGSKTNVYIGHDVDDFFTRHSLTPDQMVTPVYGVMDLLV